MPRQLCCGVCPSAFDSMVKMNIKREEILAVYEAGPEAVITLINTIIAENQKIIEQQAIRISELEERVKHLEERLNKNSRNSSKPPSTDNLASAKPNPKSQRIKSGKKPGGQDMQKLWEKSSGGNSQRF